MPAHRFAYELLVGAIPADQMVRHTCDKQDCVRPDHLEPGTHDDNMKDMVARGRAARMRGELHGRAKLTVDDVRAIRASAEPQRLVAERLGISQSNVSLIRSGRAWRHIQ